MSEFERTERDDYREYRYCKNCKHWILNDNRVYTIPAIDKEGTIINHKTFAPCALNAVEPDAGECVIFMGEDGECWDYKDAFEPSEDYLEQLAYDKEYREEYRAYREENGQFFWNG